MRCLCPRNPKIFTTSGAIFEVEAPQGKGEQWQCVPAAASLDVGKQRLGQCRLDLERARAVLEPLRRTFNYRREPFASGGRLRRLLADFFERLRGLQSFVEFERMVKMTTIPRADAVTRPRRSASSVSGSSAPSARNSSSPWSIGSTRVGDFSSGSPDMSVRKGATFNSRAWRPRQSASCRFRPIEP